MPEAERVTISFPSEPEFLRLARLASSDAGSRAGFDYEEIDDLRIAVSELTALVASGSAAPVTLDFVFVAPGEVVVEGRCASAVPIRVDDLSTTIVRAVTDEHDVRLADGIAHFRLCKRSKRPRSGEEGS